MRGQIEYGPPWDVQVDLFFYKDPEEVKKADEEDEMLVQDFQPGFDAGLDAGFDPLKPGYEAPVIPDEGFGGFGEGGFEETPAPAAGMATGGFEVMQQPPTGGFEQYGGQDFGGGFQ